MNRVFIVIAGGVLFGLACAIFGCSQVQQQTFPLKCVDRPVDQLLPGEVPFNSFTVIDASTSKIPLISAPHRMAARCDDGGDLIVGLETPVDTGLSSLATPFQALWSKLTVSAWVF